MTHDAQKTRFYELDGCPIVWEAGQFPRIAPSGQVYYDIEKLLRDGIAITRAEFEKLVQVIERNRTS